MDSINGGLCFDSCYNLLDLRWARQEQPMDQMWPTVHKMPRSDLENARYLKILLHIKKFPQEFERILDMLFHKKVAFHF